MTSDDLTRDELLDLLVEEAAEVIQAIQKIKRFGFDHFEPGYGVNHEKLALEIGDVLGIVDALEPHISTSHMQFSRHHKIRKVLEWKKIVAERQKNA